MSNSSGTGAVSRCTIAGCAIFSMLFGSGNIVFPLILGKDCAGGDLLMPFVGWILAAVILPLLGFYGAMLFDADRQKFLAPMGRIASFSFVGIVMMLVGPFGVLARIVNVAFGGFHNLLPDLPLAGFSAVYVAATTLAAIKPEKIVQMIGTAFTVVKFGGLAVVVATALYVGGAFLHPEIPAVVAPFRQGFDMGYQTMDLLAAILFPSAVYRYIKDALPAGQRNDKRKLLRFAGIACVIGALMLTVVYLGLMAAGAQYAGQLQDVPREALLGKIAELSMGGGASWFISSVIAISCLATAIILSSTFTDFVRNDILRGKANRTTVLILVGGATYGMSLLGFGKICEVLGLLLQYLYPAFIVYVVGRVICYYAVDRKKC